MTVAYKCAPAGQQRANGDTSSVHQGVEPAHQSLDTRPGVSPAAFRDRLPWIRHRVDGEPSSGETERPQEKGCRRQAQRVNLHALALPDCVAARAVGTIPAIAAGSSRVFICARCSATAWCRRARQVSALA